MAGSTCAKIVDKNRSKQSHFILSKVWKERLRALHLFTPSAVCSVILLKRLFWRRWTSVKWINEHNETGKCSLIQLALLTNSRLKAINSSKIIYIETLKVLEMNSSSVLLTFEPQTFTFFLPQNGICCRAVWPFLQNKIVFFQELISSSNLLLVYPKGISARSEHRRLRENI